MEKGLKAAALEVAAGPLPLALELLRGLDSVRPVPETALLEQPPLREHGRLQAQLSLIAQRWQWL